jgi:hypothetical protein
MGKVVAGAVIVVRRAFDIADGPNGDKTGYGATASPPTSRSPQPRNNERS